MEVVTLATGAERSGRVAIAHAHNFLRTRVVAMAQSHAQATIDSFIETQETSCNAKRPRIVSSSSKGSDLTLVQVSM